MIEEKIGPCSDSQQPSRIIAVEAADFMSHVLPPRENIVTPWFPRQGLSMVYAARGVGKTHFSLGIAHAVASGGEFLSWRVPAPRGVLFLDGEMPASILQ
jgi:putative DNA primase/helicase